MSIQSPLGVNRLARTKEVLGITALEAATPVTNAGAEGVVTAASYAAAGAAVDTATNIVHILGLGTFEATTETVTGATAGNPDDANEHDLDKGQAVFEVSTGVFKLFRKRFANEIECLTWDEVKAAALTLEAIGGGTIKLKPEVTYGLLIG